MQRQVIKASEAQPGDTYIDNSETHWIIYNVGVPDEIGVTLRLQPGRASRPEPEVFGADELITVYR